MRSADRYVRNKIETDCGAAAFETVARAELIDVAQEDAGFLRHHPPCNASPHAKQAVAISNGGVAPAVIGCLPLAEAEESDLPVGIEDPFRTDIDGQVIARGEIDSILIAVDFVGKPQASSAMV